MALVAALALLVLPWSVAAQEAGAAPAAAPWYASAPFAIGVGAVFSVLYQAAKPALGARLAGSRWGDLVLVALAALAGAAPYLTEGWATAGQQALALFTGALAAWAARYPASAEAAAKAQAKAEDTAAAQVQP